MVPSGDCVNDLTFRTNGKYPISTLITEIDIIREWIPDVIKPLRQIGQFQLIDVIEPVPVQEDIVAGDDSKFAHLLIQAKASLLRIYVRCNLGFVRKLFQEQQRCVIGSQAEMSCKLAAELITGSGVQMSVTWKFSIWMFSEEIVNFSWIHVIRRPPQFRKVRHDRVYLPYSPTS